MNMPALIKNGIVYHPAAKEKQLDLRISNGVIAEIGQHLPEHDGEQIIDAKGLCIAPGFVDLHAHLRDLGQSNREDFFTGTLAAACGGYTTVVAMANTDPPIDNALLLSRVNQLIGERACIEVIPVACVTKNMAGSELTNMLELAALGAGAFSDNTKPIMNLAVLRRALEYAQLADRIIISHAEDKDLAAEGSMNESPTSTRLGLRPMPAAAEAAAVAREIEIVRQTGYTIHFAHISTAAAVELIANAKRSGLKVTADATPHHITLTDEEMPEFDTAFKMNPPLRSKADRKALIAGLKDGTIDAIATDHAPHSRSDKAKTFDQAPFGVIGLETAFALAYEKLVLENKFSIAELFQLLAVRPAAILKRELLLNKGSAANLAILDLNQTWVYDAEKGYSKSNNSPFNGRKLTGKNIATIYNGTLAYKDDQHMHARMSSPSTVKQR